MDKQISRVDAYYLTECVNCILEDCSGRCNECKNRIDLGYRSFIGCGCLQHKPKKEKSCPFFKKVKK